MIRAAGISSSLSWVGASAISIGSILLVILLVNYDRRLVWLVLISIFGTSVWAAIDSAKIELQKYKTSIALHPLILFNLMYFLWFVLFPWYLVARSQIKAGTLPRRQVS